MASRPTKMRTFTAVIQVMLRLGKYPITAANAESDRRTNSIN